MSTAGPDPTMVELFAAEVDMHLPVLSEGLLALEKGRGGKKEIESMMRAAHSIKGAARIVGIDLAVRIAHAMEDCFSAAKEERIALSSNAVDVLLKGVDALQRTCSPQQDGAMSEHSVESLVAELATVKEGRMAVVAPVAAAAPAAAVAVATPVSMERVIFPDPCDATAREALRQQFLSILSKRPERVCIDFSKVSQMNAATLSLLLSFISETKSAQPGPTVEARGIAAPLFALFRVVGIDSALAVKP